MDLLGQRLRDLRKAKKLYQKELAEQLGVARSTLAAWEAGLKRPEGRTLERLADLFQVSVDYLLGRVDHPQGRIAKIDGEGPIEGVATTPNEELFYFLRGHQLTPEDVEAVKDLLEARRIRRQREAREGQQNDQP